MENYSYTESGESSPRSREVEFENPPPWDESTQQPPPLSKVRFMCSYGGKIHPRPHDNQLAYVGGETKILSVDRSATFSALLAKLAAMCDDENAAFKYQLPGEDLDALISVTNDDDLEHMMHEYERLLRSSNKPARLRIFVFPAQNQNLGSSARSFGSGDGRSEKERFVDALNSAPIVTAPPPSAADVAPPPPSNVDFLLGLERANVNPPLPSQHRVEIGDSIAGQSVDDRSMGLDPIQKHIQDLQRLRLEDDYRRKSDDNLNLAGGAEDYYKQPPPDKFITAGGVPYHISAGGGIYPTTAAAPNQHHQQQQVYMIPAPASGYHAPLSRQVNPPPQVPQGYYAVQSIPSDLYAEHHHQQQLQQLYNNLTQTQGAASATPTAASAPPSQGYGVVRQSIAGVVGDMPGGYQRQVLYDGSVGRQVVYGAPMGGVVGAGPQYHPAPAMSGGGDVRSAGALAQEGKGVASAAVGTKVTASQSPM